jgi:hypothetical protein
MCDYIAQQFTQYLHAIHRRAIAFKRQLAPLVVLLAELIPEYVLLNTLLSLRLAVMPSEQLDSDHCFLYSHPCAERLVESLVHFFGGIAVLIDMVFPLFHDYVYSRETVGNIVIDLVDEIDQQFCEVEAIELMCLSFGRTVVHGRVLGLFIDIIIGYR